MQARIKQLITEKGLSPSKFADVLGIQRSAISHILSGRNNPSFDVINRILVKYPDIDAKWLLTGLGTISYKNPQTKIDSFPLRDEKPATDNTSASINIEIPHSSDSLINKVFTNVNKIEKIVIFYIDKTFEEYKARN